MEGYWFGVGVTEDTSSGDVEVCWMNNCEEVEYGLCDGGGGDVWISRDICGGTEVVKVNN